MPKKVPQHSSKEIKINKPVNVCIYQLCFAVVFLYTPESEQRGFYQNVIQKVELLINNFSSLG